ncbi:MAG: hypothetical protein NT074_05930 [Methanomicrobiales archaeon]|nr:hypothetical protein [Methanomicrobiales archaeon]
MKLFKSLFGEKREAPSAPPPQVAFHDLPAWLSLQDEAEAKALEDAVAPHRETVCEAAEAIRLAMEAIREKKRDEAGLHPKIRNVLKSSLPEFEKSMKTALSHRFPPGSEAFYDGAAECLKGCVRALQGPGRYLMSAFPDTVREIRGLVDVIGRGVNAMTPAIKEAREKKAHIKEISSALHRLAEIQRDERERNAAGLDYEQRTAQKSALLSQREGELQTLRESAGYRDCQSVRDLSARAQKDLDVRERDLLNCVHVLFGVVARADKVVKRTGKQEEQRSIHRAAGLLGSDAIPLSPDIGSALSAVLPIILGMIETGVITLKNREERLYFSSPDRALPALDALAKECSDAQERHADLLSKVRESPEGRREAALLDEISRLNDEIERNRATMKRHLNDAASSQEAYTREFGEIRKRLEEVWGITLVVDGEAQKDPGVS